MPPSPPKKTSNVITMCGLCSGHVVGAYGRGGGEKRREKGEREEDKNVKDEAVVRTAGPSSPAAKAAASSAPFGIGIACTAATTTAKAAAATCSTRFNFILPEESGEGRMKMQSTLSIQGTTKCKFEQRFRDDLKQAKVSRANRSWRLL